MDAAKRFEKLEKEFVREWALRNPLLGTAIGMHEECDDRMPDGTLSKLQDDVKFLRRYETEFSAIDPKKLDVPRGVDRDLVLHLIRGWIFEREELAWWNRVPEAPQLLGESIFQLLTRNYAPLALRLRSIMKRLEQTPKYLEESKTKLVAPVKLFVENELETLTRLPGFFNQLKDVSRDNIPKTPERNLHKLIEMVQNALERYSDWLIVDILPECRDEFAVGEAKLRKAIAHYGVEMAPSSLISFGESEMERLREKLKELARPIRRKVPIEDVREMVKQAHPDTFDGAARFVRDQVSKSKQFTVRSKFATLPQGETLFISEMPTYFRHILPFSKYAPPAKLEPKREGYFYLTPGDCDSDKLKEHNVAALANRVVHEGYPGHHLMAAWSQATGSLIRSFAADPLVREGWAHYCEERMKELGFDDSPTSRFWMVHEQLFRSVRIVMDMKISLGKMGFQEGVEYLIDQVGMDRVCAESEMRRYVVTPGASVAFLIGKERIKDLKKWARERMKGRWNETFFHDAVCQSGALPLPLLKRELEWRIVEELKRPPPKEEPKGKDKKKAKGAKGAKGAPPVPAPAKGKAPAAPAKPDRDGKHKPVPAAAKKAAKPAKTVAKKR